MPIIALARRRGLLCCFASWLLLAGSSCAQGPSPAAVAVPPIPPGQARVWFYRAFIPSESLNMTEVRMNGTPAGYSTLGGAFYRDVPAGEYHITVASWGVDVNQSAVVALVPGQEAFIKIDSLRAWSELGERNGAARDTFYARLMPPPLARAEMSQTTYVGGS